MCVREWYLLDLASGETVPLTHGPQQSTKTSRYLWRTIQIPW
jgi:hypothetical protein